MEIKALKDLRQMLHGQEIRIGQLAFLLHQEQIRIQDFIKIIDSLLIKE